MFTKRSNQKGSALIFALILVLVLSVMGASLAFLSQSETWGGMNYRLMTQTRYGAEAGVNAAASYIMYQYTMPGTGGPDPITAYTYQGVSPVTVGGNPVYLSSLHGVAANYPVAAVQTAFNAASNNTLSSGNNNVTYSASAELMSMRTVIHCGNAQPLTSQVWKITSHGDIAGGNRNAEAEVTALLETQVVPCYNYAAFATSNGCGAINWSGGGPIGSYDSGNVAGGTQNYDGNLGSNGNINTAPHTTINGTFSSPDHGVGPCSSGDALTGSANQVTGCETAAQLASNSCNPSPIIQLAQPVSYPLPQTSYPPAVTFPAGFAALPTTSNGTITPGNYGDISLNGHDTLTLLPQVDPVTHVCSGGTYYINTLSESGHNTSVNIGACPPGSIGAGTYQPLIINLVGVNSAGVALPAGTSVLSLSGNSVINPTLDPRLFQVQYSGYGSVTVTGNSQSGGLVYAPNAAVTLSGANSAWYGALIGATVQMNGNGAAVWYDRRLQTDLYTVGNWTLDSFTWSKF